MRRRRKNAVAWSLALQKELTKQFICAWGRGMVPRWGIRNTIMKESWFLQGGNGHIRNRSNVVINIVCLGCLDELRSRFTWDSESCWCVHMRNLRLERFVNFYFRSWKQGTGYLTGLMRVAENILVTLRSLRVGAYELDIKTVIISKWRFIWAKFCFVCTFGDSIDWVGEVWKGGFRSNNC